MPSRNRREQRFVAEQRKRSEVAVRALRAGLYEGCGAVGEGASVGHAQAAARRTARRALLGVCGAECGAVAAKLLALVTAMVAEFAASRPNEEGGG